MNEKWLEGIRQVQGEPERVSIQGHWSISIPAGFAYTMDPTLFASNAMIDEKHGKTWLIARSAENWADEKLFAHLSDIEFTVSGEQILVKHFTDVLSSARSKAYVQEQVEALIREEEGEWGRVQRVLHNKSIAVYFCKQRNAERYLYYVFIAGVNVIYQGRFKGNARKNADENEKVLRSFLSTIRPMDADAMEAFHAAGGVDDKFYLDFSKHQEVEIGHGLVVPLPRGFTVREMKPDNPDAPSMYVIAPEDENRTMGEGNAMMNVYDQRFHFQDMQVDMETLESNFDDFVRDGLMDSFSVLDAEEVTYTRHVGAQSVLLYQLHTNEEYMMYAVNAALCYLSSNILTMHRITLMIFLSPEDREAIQESEYGFYEIWDHQWLLIRWLLAVHQKGEEPANRSSATSAKSRMQALIRRMPTATPSEELYWHYDHMRNSGSEVSNLPFVQVVVNATGTEFSCISFDTYIDGAEGDEGEEEAAAILASMRDDTPDELLYRFGIHFSRLFRVSPEHFERENDRENDIRCANLRRAKDLHTLRSFAWTLTKYKQDAGGAVETASLEEIQAVAEFVSKRESLNYDNSLCASLTGTLDLGTFYIPDSASPLDRVRLRQFTAKSEVDPDEAVASLDDLRCELWTLEPVMLKIYDELKKTRDRKKPLTGPMADVLYAWSALAVAAREPFFTEDGPMRSFYRPCTDEDTAEDEALATLRDRRRMSRNAGSSMLQNTADAEDDLEEEEEEEPSHTAPAPSGSTYTASERPGCCYIATAVYGSYDAPQVLTLRRFRDETLQRTRLGRLFIRLYYRFSPPIARKLADATHLNRMVRALLDRWVARLEAREMEK